MRWFMLAVAVPLLAINGGAAAFEIKPVHTEKCLDVTGASQAPGARIIQFGCHGGDNQRWFFRNSPDRTSQIVSARSRMCMDVEGASTGNGAAIIQFRCKKPNTSGASNQKFRVVNVPGSVADDPRVFLKNVHSGKCLDVDGASPFDGAGLIQFQCLGQPNQQFRTR